MSSNKKDENYLINKNENESLKYGTDLNCKARFSPFQDKEKLSRH